MRSRGSVLMDCFFAIVLFTAGAAPESAAHSSPPEKADMPKSKKIGLVVHGGAGTIERSTMTPERERDYRSGLERALKSGCDILKNGGSSLDAAEAAVRVQI